MAGTMRAEAPSFTPGASPELKASAVQPPPGLGMDVTPEDMQKASGWLASPVSTATPSPAMSAVSGASTSPWASPFFGSSDSLKNNWGPPFAGFALPEASVPEAAEAEESEFKLQGVEDLQKSVASLLAGLTLPPMGSDSAAEDTSSTSAGNSTEAEDSLPSTPPMLDGTADVPSTPASDSHEDMFAEEDATPESDPPLKSEEKEEEGELVGAQVSAVVAVEEPVVQVTAAPWAKAWQNKGEPDPLPARCKAAAGATTDTAALGSETPPATTVTLKNVPRSYTREILVKRLEEAGFEGNFDFVYLPADFGKSGGRGGRVCLAAGHAVVNFRTKEACERFEKAFHKVSAKKAFPGAGGTKVCEVSLAPNQGKDANVKKLQNSGLLMSLLAERPEWLPLLFDEEGASELFSTDPPPN